MGGGGGVAGENWHINEGEKQRDTLFCTFSSLSAVAIFFVLHAAYPSLPRDTPLYQLYRYVLPQRVWFLSRFGMKTSIDFYHYGLKSGMIFKGTTRAHKRE